MKSHEAVSVPPVAKDTFDLGGGFGDAADDDEDDDMNGGVGLGTNWSMHKVSNADSINHDGDDDTGAWRAAREEAAAAKEREAKRKAREEKIRTDAEHERKQRLADAAARGEEILAQRKEEEENTALLHVKKEKENEEKKEMAREAARQELLSVKQTVDLESQRDIMKQYENYGMDGELGDGSSPASADYGF